MPENLKEAIKQEIPQTPQILGSYDDEEERWVNWPVGIELVGFTRINRFLKITVGEISRLRKLLELEKIDLGLAIGIGGLKIDFKITIDENTGKTDKFVNAILKRIRGTNKALRIEKMRLTGLFLTF